MKIRQAKLGDAQALTTLVTVLGYFITKEALVRHLERSSHPLLVAEEVDGRLIGYIEAETYDTILTEELMYNVLGLAVATDRQDSGIGGQLLEALEVDALAHGIKTVRLNSGVDRHLAHEFYEKHGYISQKMQKRFLKSLL